MAHNNPMIMVKSAYRSVNANVAVQKASTPSLHPQKSNHLSCKTNPFHLRIIKKWLRADYAIQLRWNERAARNRLKQSVNKMGQENWSKKI